jgi:hypothetical protein
VADAGTQGFVTQRGGASAIARSILALKLADLRRIDMIDGGSSSRPGGHLLSRRGAIQA